jgi:predicted enzyme related to lactoylglutathione lyase
VPVTTITRITLFVDDQDTALAFYTDSLGFEVRADRAMGDHRWIEVAPAGAQTGIVLLRPFPGIPSGSTRGIMLGVSDLDAVATRLRASGVEVSGPTERPWGREATFADPSGNGFVLSTS